MLSDLMIDRERQKALYDIIRSSNGLFRDRFGLSDDHVNALRATWILPPNTPDHLSYYYMSDVFRKVFMAELSLLHSQYHRQLSIAGASGSTTIAAFTGQYPYWPHTFEFTIISDKFLDKCSPMTRAVMHPDIGTTFPDSHVAMDCFLEEDSLKKHKIVVDADSSFTDATGFVFRSDVTPRAAMLRFFVGTNKEGKPTMVFNVVRFAYRFEPGKDRTHLRSPVRIVKVQNFSTFVTAMKTVAGWIYGVDCKDNPEKDTTAEIIEKYVVPRAEVFNDRFRELLQELYGQQVGVTYRILEGSDISVAYRDAYGVHSCMTGDGHSRQRLVQFYADNPENIKLVVGYVRKKPISRQLLWKTETGWLLDRPYCQGNRKMAVLDGAAKFLEANGFTGIEYVYATNDDYPPNWELPKHSLLTPELSYDPDTGIPYLDSWTGALVSHDDESRFRLYWSPEGMTKTGYTERDDIRHTDGGLRPSPEDEDEDDFDARCPSCDDPCYETDMDLIYTRATNSRSDVSPSYIETYVCPRCHECAIVVDNARYHEDALVYIKCLSQSDSQELRTKLDENEVPYAANGSRNIWIKEIPEWLMNDLTFLGGTDYVYRVGVQEYTDLDLFISLFSDLERFSSGLYTGMSSPGVVYVKTGLKSGDGIPYSSPISYYTPCLTVHRQGTAVYANTVHCDDGKLGVVRAVFNETLVRNYVPKDLSPTAKNALINLLCRVSVWRSLNTSLQDCVNAAMGLLCIVTRATDKDDLLADVGVMERAIGPHGGVVFTGYHGNVGKRICTVGGPSEGMIWKTVDDPKKTFRFTFNPSTESYGLES